MTDNGIIPILENGVYDNSWLHNLEELPAPEILKENLEQLMCKDKSGMSADEIKQFFFEKVIFFPNRADGVPAKTFNIQQLWRTRKNIGIGENLSTILPFTYPLACEANGRANIKSQPVFYCSNTRSAALFECRPQKGDIVYLSDWFPNCTRNVNIRFLLSENISDKNPLKTLAQRHVSEICELAKLWALHKSEQLEMITRFLSNAFIEEESPYALSSWLAHDILFGNQAVDILYYPSIATKLNSCNLAITPKFADAFLKANRIFKLEIQEITDTTIRPTIVEVGVVEGPSVQWREPQQKDLEYLS